MYIHLFLNLSNINVCFNVISKSELLTIYLNLLSCFRYISKDTKCGYTCISSKKIIVSLTSCSIFPYNTLTCK